MLNRSPKQERRRGDAKRHDSKTERLTVEEKETANVTIVWMQNELEESLLDITDNADRIQPEPKQYVRNLRIQGRTNLKTVIERDTVRSFARSIKDRTNLGSLRGFPNNRAMRKVKDGKRGSAGIRDCFNESQLLVFRKDVGILGFQRRIRREFGREAIEPQRSLTFVRENGWMDERGGRQDQGDQAYKAPVRTPKK